jgi:branched-chain amino acid transport system ATP-binding protein
VEPKLIMLDEPVAGMNPTETALVTDHIRRLRDDWNMTVILVEHDMRTVMETCEYISVINFGEKLMEGLAKHAYVMETGNVAFHGLAEDLRHDTKIQETYLGA